MNRPLRLLIAFATVTAMSHPLLGQVGSNASVANPNVASLEALTEIDGVGPELAARIVEHRPYPDMVAFDAFLDGALKDTERRALYPRLFLPIDLNRASRAEIALVPGMGPRMIHEFEEYRPYRGLAEFHREIGKYVDDEELARLAQFVFVPLDPNRVTREQFLTIPGVRAEDWERLESARPYGSMEALEVALGEFSAADGSQSLLRYFDLPESD